MNELFTLTCRQTQIFCKTKQDETKQGMERRTDLDCSDAAHTGAPGYDVTDRDGQQL